MKYRVRPASLLTPGVLPGLVAEPCPLWLPVCMRTTLCHPGTNGSPTFAFLAKGQEDSLLLPSVWQTNVYNDWMVSAGGGLAAWRGPLLPGSAAPRVSLLQVLGAQPLRTSPRSESPQGSPLSIQLPRPPNRNLALLSSRLRTPGGKALCPVYLGTCPALGRVPPGGWVLPRPPVGLRCPREDSPLLPAPQTTTRVLDAVLR